MFGFKSKNKVIVDLKKKRISVKEYCSLIELNGLLTKEFTINPELKNIEKPFKLIFEDEEGVLTLNSDWVFTRKTQGTFKRKINARYKKIVESKPDSITYYFKKL